MQKRRNVDQQNFLAPTSSQHTQIDIALSPSSSYEEISYKQAYRAASSASSSHSQHHLSTYQPSQNPYLDATVDSHEDHLHLPLHNMEAEARLRRAHNAPAPDASGWTSADQSAGYRDSVGGSRAYPSYGQDDGKGVYEKERIGYASGKLPPRQSKTPVSLVSCI